VIDGVLRFRRLPSWLLVQVQPARPWARNYSSF
jgi:hypothetical protein